MNPRVGVKDSIIFMPGPLPHDPRRDSCSTTIFNLFDNSLLFRLFFSLEPCDIDTLSSLAAYFCCNCFLILLYAETFGLISEVSAEEDTSPYSEVRVALDISLIKRLWRPIFLKSFISGIAKVKPLNFRLKRFLVDSLAKFEGLVTVFILDWLDLIFAFDEKLKSMGLIGKFGYECLCYANGSFAVKVFFILN